MESVIKTAALRLRFTLAFAAVLCGMLLAGAADAGAPLEASLNEQIIMIPAGPQLQVALETTLFKPYGAGPFPLLIINHGKQPGSPRLQERDRFLYLATAFVRRGYAVLVPMRSGFAQSTGRYADYGCNMTANGDGQASDVRDVLSYARQQSWIDPQAILVAGQSYGGLATMALPTAALSGVRGLLNFAGGLRVDGAQCDWQAALVRAFGQYGARSKVPSLWLYGANDSYFSGPLVRQMHQAFIDAGGRATLFAYGPFKRDAHVMLSSRDGEKIWLPEIERFLRQIDMPSREVYLVAHTPPPLKSNFAPLNDIAAVPFVADSGRAAYRGFLDKMMPRAFAVSASGAWGWAEEGEEPDHRALAACQRHSSQPCSLYSVDEDVVWPGMTAVGRTH